MPLYVARRRHPDPAGGAPASGFDTGMTYTDSSVTGGITTISGLQTFIDGVADGSSSTNHRRILLGAGRTYTGSTGLNLNGRNHLTLEGGGTDATYGHTGGAAIACTGSGSSLSHSPIYTATGGSQATDLRFHGLTVEGSSTVYATTSSYSAGNEYQMGFGFMGTAGALIDHCIMQKVMGDGVYASDRASGSGTWSSDIVTQYSLIQNNGRMGIAIIACDRFRVSYTKFHDIALVPCDFEPNNNSQGGSDIQFDNNLITGNWSWSTAYNDPLFMVTSGVGFTDCTITGYYKILNNTVTGSKYDNTGAPWIGPFHLTFGPTVKDAILTIDSNTCTAPTAGYIGLIGGWVNGGTVTNNTGFWTGSGTYFSTFEAPNGTITYSGNT